MRKHAQESIDKSFIGKLYEEVKNEIQAAHPTFTIEVFPKKVETSSKASSLNKLYVIINFKGVIVSMDTNAD